MRVPIMGKLSIGLSLCALLLVACDSQKEPAQAAFAQIQASVNPVATDLEKYAPVQYAELSTLIDDMKAKLNTKDYAGALALRGDVMNKLAEVSGAAGKHKNELVKQLTGEWRQLATSIPVLLTQVNNRVGDLQNMKKLPGDVTAAAVQQAKQSMVDLGIEWTTALDAVKRRDTELAVTKAREIKQRAADIGASLGLKALT
jgi:hypothetical protein